MTTSEKYLKKKTELLILNSNNLLSKKEKIEWKDYFHERAINK